MVDIAVWLEYRIFGRKIEEIRLKQKSSGGQVCGEQS